MSSQDPAGRGGGGASGAGSAGSDTLATDPFAETHAAGTEVSAGQAPELLGGRYQVLGELGRGAEGVVYRARDIKAHAVVAIKLLPYGLSVETRLKRFRRELQMARRVTHTNVVRIYDLVELPDRFGLSMELVDGESLDRRIARGALARDDLVALALDLARALAAAHAAGVVHRDLKPGNVLIRRADGKAVVTDFGVSRALEAREGADAAAPDSASLHLTQEGTIVGTPAYMAPEQLYARHDVGPAADVYSFGLVVREAATGKRLHQADTIGELVRLRTAAPPPPLQAERPDLPALLCATVDRALAREAADRFASGVGRHAELAPPPPRTPVVAGAVGGARAGRRWPGVAAAVLGVAAIGATALVVGPRLRASRDGGAEHLGPASASGPALPAPPSMRAQNLRRLTFGNGCEEYPVFTPDGRSVLYDGTVDTGCRIFRLDLGGGAPVALTQGHGFDIRPDVSPAADRIVYQRQTSTESAAYVEPADGSAPPRRLARVTGAPSWSYDGRGVWCPQGNQVIEVDANSGEPLRTLVADDGQVVAQVLELQSGSVVTRATAHSRPATLTLFGPDGSSRALASPPTLALALAPGGRGVVATALREDRTAGLAEVPLDGSPLQPLSSGLDIQEGFAFSHDGSRVAWSECREHTSVWRLDAQGHLVAAMPGQDRVRMVAPIPGSDEVAVVSERTGQSGLWISSLSGGPAPREVPLGELRPLRVAVSHDGSWFVVTTENTGVYIGSLRGEPRLRALTSNPFDAWPGIRFGGAQVLFTRPAAEGNQVMAVPVAGGEPVALLPPGSDLACGSPVEDRVLYLEGAFGAQTPRVWDGRTGISRPLSSALAAGLYSGTAFSSDGRRAAVVRGGSEIVEVDVATGRVLRVWSSRGDDVLSNPAYVSSGLLLVRHDWSGNLWIADLSP